MRSQSDIRTSITNTIVEALTTGKTLPPWRKPWTKDPNAPGLHTSLSTGNPYQGINQILLQVAATRHGFQSKWWGTYNQIQFNGASVRKGQKATKIILWKPIQRKRTDENGNETEDSFLMMREFSVFNAEQTTGLEEFRVGFVKPEDNADERYEHADAVIDATSADIRHGGNRAYYSIDGDYIQMPFRHQFDAPESYYETLLHEVCHWSEKRVGLDRNQPENSYAFFELVAEIGSCFLMGELSLPTTDNLDNHAAYLQSWLKGMNDDPKFIFKAAAQASKAADFILSFSRTPEQVEEPVVA